MEGWIVILSISIVFYSRSYGQFTDPYIAEDYDNGTVAVKSFTSELGNPIVANSHSTFGLSDWNRCDNYDFAVDITEGEMKLQIEIDNKFSGNGKNPDCTVYWGDGQTSNVSLNNGVKKEDYLYAEFGIYPIYVVCSRKDLVERCPHSISDCLQTSDILDDMYQSLKTPLTFFSNKPILIKSYMQFVNTSCSFPSIVWQIMTIENGKLAEEIHRESGNSVLRLEGETLNAGEYVVSLNVSFPNISKDHWSVDFLVMKIVYPELVTYINGGELLSVPHGQDVFVDASQSHDPLEGLPLGDIHIEWSLVYYNSTVKSALGFQEKFEYFTVSYPEADLPAGGTARPIQNGTEYVLMINTGSFPVSSTAVVIFSMSRGTRVSSAMQVLEITTAAIPISLQCIYNCHIGRERMFYNDRIEVDIVFPDGMNTVDFQYVWSVNVWNQTTQSFRSPLTPVSMQTSDSSQAIGITSYPTQGLTYRLSVTVNSPDGYTGNAQLIRTANYLPYDGHCEVDMYSVTSARDWVSLTCSSWYGNDDRHTKSSILDDNPILTYSVIQQTTGAAVFEEPILQTQSQRSHVILKVGDPKTTYNTTLLVLVTDIYNDYTEVMIDIQSYPVFDVSSVSPTQHGANLITEYTTTDYAFDEKQLRDMGKDDMIISLVSAVCSNIHLIEIPVWIPPAPRVLNTNGSVIDLNARGNEDIGTMDEAAAAANNVSADPATLAIQDVMQDLTKLIEEVVDDTIRQGYRADDKMLSSLLTNVFTNLIYKEQFINTEAKVSIILVGQFVGLDALKDTNSSVDQSAQIEITSGEIFRMFQATVNSVVPDDLTQNRPIDDLLNGGTQIDEMLTVLNQNISIYDTKMSPMERAYLYLKMQQYLRYTTDDRKNASRKAANASIILARDIQTKLKLCSKCNNRESNSTQQLVHKNTGSNVTGDVIPLKSSSTQFRISGLNKALENNSIDGTGTVDVSAFEFDENVYMYDDDGTSGYVTSKVLRVDVKSSDQQIYPDEMTFDQFVQTPAAKRVTPEVSEDDVSEFMYHNFIYQKASDHVCMIVKPVIEEFNATIETNITNDGKNITMYEVYFGFETSPNKLEYDFIVTVYEDDDWVYCVPPSSMNGHTGITYIGIDLSGSKKLNDYDLTIVTVGCLTWDENSNKWHTDKCLLDWIPEYNKLSCYCHDVTDMVFANSFFVAPNSIDFSSVFLKFSPLSQAAVMGTLISIYVVYLIGVILLRRLDKGDKLKWGMTPLCDNIVSDNHFYLIKVHTGMRSGAGTESAIAFNLKGTLGETGPRSLSDGIRPGFSRGSCMTFFMATHSWLGPLQYISIWHDTEREETFTSWYLNQVVVYDVTKAQTYTFVAEKWLSVKTNVYIHIPSHTKEEPISFESRFFYQTRDRLSEGHMWASIFYRPQVSVFTRVQRLSCALVYILLTMIANAMYFDPEPNYEAPPLLQVGPFRFTGQQIYVSIISALITTPPIMLLMFLFNRVQPKSESKPCCCRCCCCCHHGTRKNQTYSRRTNSRGDGELHFESEIIDTSPEEKLKSKLLTLNSPQFVGKLYLPHRFINVIWVIVLASVAVPSFFIVLYSMEWGKQKSEEWLTTFFLSLIESATLVDPVMVVCIALLLATVKRVHVETTTVDVVEIVRKYRKLVADKTDRERLVSPPLEDDSLEAVQRKKKHHSELTSSLRDLTMASLFAMLVFSIAFSNRDDRSYLCHSEIVNTIIEPWKMPQFTLIQTPGDLYTWLNVSVIPNLFPDSHYNGEVLHWSERETMSGQHSLRLGPPRLRQLRSKRSECKIPYIGTVECNPRYSITNEDEDSFCIGWKDMPCSVEDKVFSSSLDAWKFTSALDIWGLPLSGHHTTYGGGGYIATFAISRSNTVAILNELFTTTWINRQTRAVLLEFTLYNLGTNMFIYTEFLVEFPETGGALTSFAIYPMRLYSHHGGIGTFTLICEVLFLICLIVFLGKICVRLCQQGLHYFKTFWQVYELVMFAIGVAAVVAFFIRLALTSLTISKFREDKRRFVNFAHIVAWDQIYVTLLGVLAFMATLRLLQTFSASNRIKSIVTIFKDCGKDLFWFSTCFVYLLVGFCFFGLFLFGSHLRSYMSIYRSLTTLFLAMIGKSKFAEIEETQPVLAKIFFSFYILAVVFYVLTIFFSILGASIDAVTHDTRVDDVEDLLDYMGKALKRLFKKPKAKIGLRRKSSVEFTKIERIYIPCSSAISRRPTPPPWRENTWLASEPAISALRPHPFSRFKTLKVQRKISQGHSVFIGE